MSTATVITRPVDAVPAASPGALAIPAEDVGAMLSISARSVRRMHAAGLLPRPVRVMGSVRCAWTSLAAGSRTAVPIAPSGRQYTRKRKWERPRGATPEPLVLSR